MYMTKTGCNLFYRGHYTYVVVFRTLYTAFFFKPLPFTEAAIKNVTLCFGYTFHSLLNSFLRELVCTFSILIDPVTLLNSW